MKTVLITGANVGIGFATARYLASWQDLRVLLACRNQAKANLAIAAIREANAGANLGFVPLDLFSLASVRRVPEMPTLMGAPPLSGLILNAGGINMKAKSLEFTEDGFERTFQLNFLGHFLPANLLVSSMAARLNLNPAMERLKLSLDRKRLRCSLLSLSSADWLDLQKSPVRIRRGGSLRFELSNPYCCWERV
jgi:NAD(P)-dependent dehydrogenase (short-subunit alcohol dehydrogenase family)